VIANADPTNTYIVYPHAGEAFNYSAANLKLTMPPGMVVQLLPAHQEPSSVPCWMVIAGATVTVS
jgi:hypothetical protein